MMTISARLEIEKEDEAILDSLLNRWSAAYHTAFNLLIGSKPEKDVQSLIRKQFSLEARYARFAIMEAKSKIAACKELGTNPRRVIFGGRKLFRRLQQHHLNYDRLISLKTQYRETRRFNLLSVGERCHNGNLNARVMGKSLRINVSKRKFIYATIHTTDKRWLKINQELYTVRILKRNDKYYAHFSFEEVGLPPVTHTFENGCIAIDLNAKPAHIAWVELDAEGNLRDRGEIATPMLYDQRKYVRDYYAYVYAKQLAAVCVAKNKGLVLEKLHKLPAGTRVISNFCYAKLTKAIEVICARSGVASKQVWAAYTSQIGCLKYAPLQNLSRHTAAAIVIGRRGLGLKDKLPKHLEPLAAPHKSSSIRNVGSVSVTRWKKEAESLRNNFGAAYRVCRAALSGLHKLPLTEGSSGPNGRRRRRRRFRGINWSILHRFVSCGTDARFDTGLGPSSVGGLRRQRRRVISN